MKSTLVLTLLLAISFGKANAQFLEIGDKWIFDYRDYGIGNGYYSEKFDSIEVVSDTMINGLLYHKLEASDIYPCGIFRLVEFLREDSNRIYRLHENGRDENLMIDFNHQSSYDMTYEYGGMEIQTHVINDSVGIEVLPSGDQIDVTYQRIINNSSYGDEAEYKLSNEIGYVDPGLLFPDIGTGFCDVNEIVNLRCKISGTDTIRLTELDCYESSKTSGIKEVEKTSPIIYPNPTRGIILISGDYEPLSIQSLTGTIKRQSFFKNVVDISTFPKGIYFITLKSRVGDGISTFRIVKI
jgi:hypothetical protein